jgi:type VI secretion system ImpC/EvpB family protein
MATALNRNGLYPSDYARDHLDLQHGSDERDFQSITPSRLIDFHPFLESFLHDDRGEALHWWRLVFQSSPCCCDQFAQYLDRELVRLDEALTEQVNAILHHPRFQQLEASWRSLQALTERVSQGSNIKIRILDLRWDELCKDIDKAIEFDQSQLFRKVYSDEFGMPGGEPVGVLIGDYYLHHKISAEHPTNDLAVLGGIASVAAAAFAPFVAGIAPSFLGLDSFAELDGPLDLGQTLEQHEYLKWHALRKREDARFVGLTLPRVLLRQPYTAVMSDGRGFSFHESVDNATGRTYLWGNACYAFAANLVRSFEEFGWLADISGNRRAQSGGGVVEGFPALVFPTDGQAFAPLCVTESCISDFRQPELHDLGLLALCQCQGVPNAAFYSVPSIQQPARYDEESATANARLSATLSYILSACRFAHYVKVRMRDRTGAFSSAWEIEKDLTTWLLNYCTGNESASLDQQARYPLREVQVEVNEILGRPGSLRCTIHLKPHYQLERMSIGIRLVTDIGIQNQKRE